MSWTAPSFITEIAERLEAWPALAEVRISSAPVLKMTSEDLIVFIRAPGTQEWATLGNGSKADSYSVEGSVVVAYSGTGESKASEVRARVGFLMDAVEDCIRDLARDTNKLSTLASDIGATQITTLTLRNITLAFQAENDGKRIAQADFTVDVVARI